MIGTNTTGQNLTVNSGTAAILYLNPNGGTESHFLNTRGTLTTASSFNETPKSVTFSNGANDNVNVSGVSVMVVTGPSGSFNFSGTINAIAGQHLTLMSEVAQALTIKNNTTSTQKIFTLTGSDLVLAASSSMVELRFDGTQWFVMSARDSGGSH
jgi:hypothetical protein